MADLSHPYPNPALQKSRCLFPDVLLHNFVSVVAELRQFRSYPGYL